MREFSPPPHSPGPAWGQDGVAQMAIALVRRSLYGSRCCGTSTAAVLPFLTDMHRAGTMFRLAHTAMLGAQGIGLPVAPPGAVGLSRTERRLLRAVAAAQAGEEILLDHYLCKLAPHPKARAPLAEAVRMLAAMLAMAGGWLSFQPLPDSSTRRQP